MAYWMKGKRNRQALVNMNISDIDETTSKKLDKKVGATSCTDSKSGSAEALELEPPPADERTSITTQLRVKTPENLDD